MRLSRFDLAACGFAHRHLPIREAASGQALLFHRDTDFPTMR
jgi:hypothetical protein